MKAEELAKAMAAAAEDNEKFLKELDRRLAKADLRYAQMENEADVAYLKMAKKRLGKKSGK